MNKIEQDEDPAHNRYLNNFVLQLLNIFVASLCCSLGMHPHPLIISNQEDLILT